MEAIQLAEVKQQAEAKQPEQKPQRGKGGPEAGKAEEPEGEMVQEDGGEDDLDEGAEQVPRPPP